MIYDYKTDETYFTMSESGAYDVACAGKVSCIRCVIDKREFEGFRLSDGDFCCNGCKAEALQSGVIALCLDCGDYFWIADTVADTIACPACQKPPALLPK